MCVSRNTVKFHLKNIYNKLEVTSRFAATSLWAEVQASR